MQKINVIYEGDTEHADIISVPDSIAQKLDETVQLFFDWLKIRENHIPFLHEIRPGRMVLMIGAKEFVWWLNNSFAENQEKADLLMTDVAAIQKYKSIDF